MAAGPRLGIDFGTSHTVALLAWPDGRVRPLLFDGSPLLPSAVFAQADGALLVGRDAVHAARVDPSRFEGSPKRRIDDGTVLLGDREVTVPALIGAVLGHVAQEATRVAGGPVSELTLTHPAAWGVSRRLALVEGAKLAGLPQPALMPEPVAAAHYFAGVLQKPLTGDQGLLVYDFGGGTFDASLVSRAGEGFDVRAVDGIDDLGGLDLDALIVEHARQQIEDPAVWARLDSPQSTEDRRHRRMLWDDARIAKEMLSRTNAAALHVPIAAADVSITREQFEDKARPLLEQTVRTTAAVVRWAGQDKEKLAGLFLVGGSSRVPLVVTLLQKELGLSPTIIEQPELVVAEGSLRAWVNVGRQSAAPAVQNGQNTPTPQNAGFAQGAPAAAGQPGAAGPQGAPRGAGLPAAAGAAGAAGLHGAAGAQGAGAAGAAGFQGAGAQGAGAAGAAGFQGAGAQGAAGLQGAAGGQGAAGLQGAAGAQGAAGMHSQAPVSAVPASGAPASGAPVSGVPVSPAAFQQPGYQQPGYQQPGYQQQGHQQAGYPVSAPPVSPAAYPGAQPVSGPPRGADAEATQPIRPMAAPVPAPTRPMPRPPVAPVPPRPQPQMQPQPVYVSPASMPANYAPPPREEAPPEPQRSGPRRNIAVPLLVGILVLALALAGYVVFQNRDHGQNRAANDSPTTATSAQGSDGPVSLPPYSRESVPSWTPDGWKEQPLGGPDQLWISREESEGGRCDANRDRLKVTSSAFTGCTLKGPLDVPMTDGSIEAKVNVTSGCGGMSLRTGDRGYMLGYCADGQVRIYKLGSERPGDSNTLAKWQVTPGSSPYVAFIVQGTSLSVYLNGKRFGPVTNGDIKQGKIDLGAFSPDGGATEASFSQVRIIMPDDWQPGSTTPTKKPNPTPSGSGWWSGSPSAAPTSKKPTQQPT